MFAFGHLDVEFGRVHRVGQAAQRGVQVGLFRQVFEHARAGIEAVVEAVPAFLEKDVAGHFAGEQCAGFLHLGLDETVAGLPQRGLAAACADPVEQVARGFHVEDDFGARVARQHVVGEQHQLAVGENDGAVLHHHAQAVAVAVEGQAEFGVAGFQARDQVGEVLRLRGVGVVIGEIAVDLAEHFFDLAAECAVQGASEGARHAVAAVDDELHRPRELDVGDDARMVFGGDVVFAIAACAAGEVALDQALAQLLDGVSGQCLATQHHLQAVIVGRVVATGDHDRAVRPELIGGEIGHRRGHHAEVDDADAGFADAACKRCCQVGT